MKVEFEENEFTTQELLFFLEAAYTSQLNGKPFTGAIIRNWIRIKHFPAAYGGYRIISDNLYRQFGNTRVLAVEGLTREEVLEMIGPFQNQGNSEKQSFAKKRMPRKLRTKSYYEILKAAGKQYTKTTLEQSTLPLYWKEAGIKKNQLINKKANTTIKV